MTNSPAAGVVHRVQELQDLSGLSKHHSLVGGILASIEEKVLTRGDLLPSVNYLADKTGYARQTIVKAYTELKERGIVEAKHRRGYFVASETTQQQTTVALVLYAFLPFQESFYNTFRHSLGDTAQVDTFFHHNNADVFEDMLNKISGQYSFYVIAAPEHPRVPEMLQQLPKGRCLVVDRPSPDPTLPFVSQQFAEPTAALLESLLDRVRRYREVILYYNDYSDYPVGIETAFTAFAQRHGLGYRVAAHYEPGSVRPGQLHITISDTDLWQLLEDCVDQELALGQDIGIVSHNDSRIKKIICGGITTISTDFRQMGQRAAEYILHRQPTQEFVPTLLIERGSL